MIVAGGESRDFVLFVGVHVWGEGASDCRKSVVGEGLTVQHLTSRG